MTFCHRFTYDPTPSHRHTVTHTVALNLNLAFLPPLYSVMIGDGNGEKLEAAIASGGAKAMLTPTSLKASHWDIVEKVLEPTNWPAHKDDQGKILRDLKKTHDPSVNPREGTFSVFNM